MPSAPALAAAGILVLAMIAAIALGIDLARFLSRVPTLRSDDDLADFRRVVARQMYGALFMLAMAFAAGAVIVGGTITGHTRPIEWVFLGVVGMMFGAVGIWNKSIERKAKVIPAEGEYAEQRDAIVEVWMKRPFPNW
jgi:hypothetical protein